MEKQFLSASGVPVYTYENRALHGFCLSLYLRAGSLYETAQNNGISHFYEHIAIRNINARMGGKLYETLDRCGLDFDASTCKEYIQFSLSGSTSRFETACDLIVRLFEPITLSAADVDTERNRIKAEIREDNVNTSFYAFTQGKVWEDSPLAFSITGTAGNISKMCRSTLRDAQKTFLSANNIFFYITGKIPGGGAEKLCARLDRIPLCVTEAERTNHVSLPVHFGSRPDAIHTRFSDVTAVTFTFDCPGNYKDAERVLLYDILSSGDSNLLYQNLSERTGYVYSFSPENESYENAGSFSFEFEIPPQKLIPAVKTAVSTFNSLKSGVGESLALAKVPYIENAELLYDSRDSLNDTLAYECHILGLPYVDMKARKKAYADVTPSRLRTMACDVFTRRNLTFTMQGNTKKLPVSEIRELLAMLG